MLSCIVVSCVSLDAFLVTWTTLDNNLTILILVCQCHHLCKAPRDLKGQHLFKHHLSEEILTSRFCCIVVKFSKSHLLSFLQTFLWRRNRSFTWLNFYGWHVTRWCPWRRVRSFFDASLLSFSVSLPSFLLRLSWCEPATLFYHDVYLSFLLDIKWPRSACTACNWNEIPDSKF